MRLDTDIKADIIGELEEVHDSRHGQNLLDALMVEAVAVRDGDAQITLVFEDDRTEAERQSIEAQIRELTADVDGLKSLHFDNMTATQLRRMDPLAFVPGQRSQDAPTVAPEAPDASVGAPGGVLTLGALMANVEEPAPEEEPDSGLNLYAGGGCAAGTAPAATASQPSRTSPPARATAPAQRTAVLADGMVTLTAEEFANLVAENRVLRERIRTLSNILHTLANDLEG